MRRTSTDLLLIDLDSLIPPVGTGEVSICCFCEDWEEEIEEDDNGVTKDNFYFLKLDCLILIYYRVCLYIDTFHLLYLGTKLDLSLLEDPTLLGLQVTTTGPLVWAFSSVSYWAFILGFQCVLGHL